MKTVTMVLTSVILMCIITLTEGQLYPNLIQGLDSRRAASKIDFDEHSGITEMFKALAGMVKYYQYTKRVRIACLTDITTVVREILLGNRDALAFLDAYFKPESGIMEGNIWWAGDYSQCLSINTNISSAQNTLIRGKYYTVQLELGYDTSKPKLFVGICLPHTCQKNDFEPLLSLVLRLIRKNLSLVSVHDADEPATFTSGVISAFTVLTVLFVLVVVGTFLDVYLTTQKENKQHTPKDANSIEEDVTMEASENRPLLNSGIPKTFLLRVLVAFSIVNNTKNMLNNPSDKRRFACFHGLWVLSIFWVILRNTYLVSASGYSNIVYAVSLLSNRLTFQPILNGSLAVDTLLFLNGLHIALEGLVEIRLKGRINWLHYFPRRLWRHMPLYAFILFVYTTLLPVLVRGPFSWTITSAGGEITKCSHSWWSNLLFINNVYPNHGGFNSSCMYWSSYIALDMQFYLVIASTFLLILHKFKVFGIVYSVLLILLCVSVRGGLAAYFDMNIIGMPTKHSESEWKNALWNNYPFTRWSAYIVGLLTGLTLFEARLKIKINKYVSIFGWLICSVSALLVIYGTYGHDKIEIRSDFSTRLYVAVAPTVWSLCLAWIVLACMSGKGGLINTILSLGMWNPLNRLTFSAFLINPIVLIGFLSSLMSHFIYNDFLVLCIYLGVLIVTYGLSYIVFVTVELPFLHLGVIFPKTLCTNQNT